MYKNFIKFFGIILCLVIVLSIGSLAFCGVFDVPDKIYLSADSEQKFEFGLPFNVNIHSSNKDIFTINGLETQDQNLIDLRYPIVLKGNQEGDSILTVELLGLTLKQVQISSRNDRHLICGGESIGVTLYTRGALVVGTGEITVSDGNTINPAKQAGLMPGDIIEKINGVTVENSTQLSSLIHQDSGKDIHAEVRRNDKIINLTITPVKDAADSQYRIGVWVRDSTAGVGTLTYYDEINNSFGGLGHAIIDVDTGQILTLKDGEIIQSNILDVDKGQSGKPGELHGTFSLVNKRLGEIKLNTEFGIYGTIYDKNALTGKSLPVGTQDEVEYGKASILTTIDENGIQEFECEIIKISPQQLPSQKGMVIKITDEELLSKTGGIVQGMSGSPIIQNGKIIGAVTHVFLNSPDKGYGMFIEWMLKCSDSL